MKWWVPFIVLCLFPTTAFAHHGPKHPQDPMHGKLFPPELVMRHQAELKLTKTQRKKLLDEMKSAQGELLEKQFEVQEAAQKLADLMGQTKVDETKAIAQAGEVMRLEQAVKTRHLTLLIRVKNLLTEEQQNALRKKLAEP